MRMFKRLTFTDRLRIEAMLKEKKSKREIADTLRVHISTIYRELDRGKYEHLNSDYTTEIRYSPDVAQSKIEETYSSMGPDLKIGKDHELANYLEHLMLDESYSPDAALGAVKHSGIQFNTSICRATLYSYIRKGVFLRLTVSDLPRHGKRKRSYHRVEPSRAPRGESIEKRPEEINERRTFGHWEMDTVVGGRNSKKALLVLTERLTRKEVIIRLPNKTADSTVKALDKLERRYGRKFSSVFKSITVDNGSEFADCEGLEKSVYGKRQRTKLYYCHPYSAYERGSNENQNILIRRFFPKGCSFDKITHKYIQHVESWINRYPRAIFDYRTADNLFDEYVFALGA